MNEYVFMLLVIAAVTAIVWAINRHRMKAAMRMRGAKIPVCRNDCFSDYEEVIRVVLQRMEAVQGSRCQMDILKDLGFNSHDDMRRFYPAIAMIRLCHLSGYEVEFRPMRRENSPVQEREIVIRLTEREHQKAS